MHHILPVGSLEGGGPVSPFASVLGWIMSNRFDEGTYLHWSLNQKPVVLPLSITYMYVGCMGPLGEATLNIIPSCCSFLANSQLVLPKAIYIYFLIFSHVYTCC